jgi:peptide/nickel transport system permease protein
MASSIRAFATARGRGRGEPVSAALTNSKLFAGALLLAAIVLISLAGPQVYRVDPLRQNLFALLQPPGFSEGGFHPLGTDPNGRDMLSIIISGGRVSLLVGVSSMLVAGTLGIALGLISGYFGGWIDAVVMRLVDLQLAFPFILLAIFASAILGKSLGVLMIILALNGWMVYARTVRGEVLVLREHEFVLAARCVGATHARMLIRHFLPNLATSVVVISTIQVGALIIAESSVSFLGFGVQPPTPSWGRMLGEGRNYLTSAWWVATFPGLAILTTVLAINLVGEGLRDRLILRR